MATWIQLLSELQDSQDENGNEVKGLNLDQLREKYLSKLSKKTGRNVIAYYSGWLKGRNQNIDINDNDMPGFMNAINGLDTNKGVDIILHTPGGNPTATEGIVKYLHSKFNNDIRVIVPQMAMSAGTMFACSSKMILMGLHSCLGPIDPQFGGIPAYNIIDEFRDAKKDLEQNDKSKEYWKIQFDKYPVAFFYTVFDSINLSAVLASEWLKKYMFDDLNSKESTKKINKIIKKLNTNNKSHSRHFSYQDCLNMGLKVQKIEDDQELQDLIISVHYAYTITINNSQVAKIIENQNGNRYLSFQQ